MLICMLCMLCTLCILGMLSMLSMPGWVSPGPGSVIKAFDLGVATMRKGEVVLRACCARHAVYAARYAVHVMRVSCVVLSNKVWPLCSAHAPHVPAWPLASSRLPQLLPCCLLQVSKLIITSEYGYGDAGSPPKIPGGATLVGVTAVCCC